MARPPLQGARSPWRGYTPQPQTSRARGCTVFHACTTLFLILRKVLFCECADLSHRRAGAEGAEDYPWPFWRPWFDSTCNTKATAAGSAAAGVAAVASFTLSRRLLWQRVAQQLQPRDLNSTAKIESFGQFVRTSAPWCAARLAHFAVLLLLMLLALSMFLFLAPLKYLVCSHSVDAQGCRGER